MRTRITLRSILSILLTLAALPLWALGNGSSTSRVDAGIIGKSDRVWETDSLLPVRNSYYGKEELIFRFRHEDITARNEEPASRNTALASRNEELIPRNAALLSDLLQTEADYNTTGNSRRALVHLLKILRVKRNRWDARSGARLFGDLAHVSVKLKLYSLAMKCYYKATQYTDRTQLLMYRNGEAGFSEDVEPATEDDNTLDLTK